MDLLKPLIALLAIVNPIGVVPFFIHFTQAMDRTQRQRTIRVSSTTARGSPCVVVVMPYSVHQSGWWRTTPSTG